MNVNCDHCGRVFERQQCKINEGIKRGYQGNFCNRTCANRRRNKIYLQEDDDTHFRWFLARSKTRSNRLGRKIDSEITVEDLKNQWRKQSGICPYTGWQMLLPKNASGWNGEKSIKRASVDRIDSSKPYTPDNIHFVCLIANYAKNSFTEKELIDFCEAVAKRLKIIEQCFR